MDDKGGGFSRINSTFGKVKQDKNSGDWVVESLGEFSLYLSTKYFGQYENNMEKSVNTSK